MNNRNLVFFCGLAAGFALKTVCDTMAQPAGSHSPQRKIRPAGRREMDNPPRDWDIVDEQSDESFPASDPPGNY
ncbi:hypothetical protein JWJ88_05705 [Paracoccus methylovorus]|uniref:Secreted protein n=1 Tax=Paracoccus methylovorus TaxID=2812658 RepID=A0ABX7JD26_9RHOB|nr:MULTISPECIES: hypothetical protein [Paracoccus]QRZ12143.1 hypothetical protein JWJ88_05705 [Paracoccus methylovorus]